MHPTLVYGAADAHTAASDGVRRGRIAVGEGPAVRVDVERIRWAMQVEPPVVPRTTRGGTSVVVAVRAREPGVGRERTACAIRHVADG